MGVIGQLALVMLGTETRSRSQARVEMVGFWTRLTRSDGDGDEPDRQWEEQRQ
jgi:hypothetical protein